MRRLAQLLALLIALLLLAPVGAPLSGPLGLLPAATAGQVDPWAAAVSSPKEDPYYPRHGDPRIDVLHYGLDLHWNRDTRVLTGTATIDLRIARATEVVLLDLDSPLRVDEVTVDGRAPASVSRPGPHLRLGLGSTAAADSRHQVLVHYRGKPRTVAGPAERSDVAHLGWTTTRDGQAWTMQEPFGAYTWYPVNDHPSDKAFYDATMSVPRPWTGVFNGALVSTAKTDQRKVTTFHMDEPASSYLVTMAIGPYRRHTATGPHGLPIVNWLPADATEGQVRRAASIGDLVTWLEAHQGPYPFSRVGVVAVPGGSAMETQTLVTLNESLLGPGWYRRAVVLHELAHHWYGDTVTPDNWKDLWLSESWAMYTQFRWEVDKGIYTMREVRRILRTNDQDARDDDGPPGEYHPGEFGDLCVYYCGALMLDQMNAIVGDTAFDDVWSAWPAARALSNSNRADYEDWVSARTGHDLHAFITEWLTSPTTPELVPR